MKQNFDINTVNVILLIVILALVIYCYVKKTTENFQASASRYANVGEVASITGWRGTGDEAGQFMNRKVSINVTEMVNGVERYVTDPVTGENVTKMVSRGSTSTGGAGNYFVSQSEEDNGRVVEDSRGNPMIVPSLGDDGTEGNGDGIPDGEQLFDYKRQQQILWAQTPSGEVYGGQTPSGGQYHNNQPPNNNQYHGGHGTSPGAHPSFTKLKMQCNKLNKINEYYKCLLSKGIEKETECRFSNLRNPVIIENTKLQNNLLRAKINKLENQIAYLKVNQTKMMANIEDTGQAELSTPTTLTLPSRTAPPQINTTPVTMQD